MPARAQADDGPLVLSEALSWMAFSVTMMMSADGARRGVVGDEAEAAHASLGRRARGGGPFRRVASSEEASVEGRSLALSVRGEASSYPAPRDGWAGPTTSAPPRLCVRAKCRHEGVGATIDAYRPIDDILCVPRHAHKY